MRRPLLGFQAAGCTCELSDDDPTPSTDSPAPRCGGLAPTTCWDDCCVANRGTTFDPAMLRTRDCCECGGAPDPDSLVAIRRDGIFDFLGLVCDTGAACDDCLPTYLPRRHHRGRRGRPGHPGLGGRRRRLKRRLGPLPPPC